MPARWPEEREKELKQLVASGLYTYGEIAKKMGLGKSLIAQKAQMLGLKNPTYLNRKTKHKHLHESLLRYFLHHTAKECQDHFNLTESEFRSCLTVAYRKPHFAHIRKETRRHDLWTANESVILLRRAGVMPRIMIAHKLRRGGVHAVKEQLQRLGTGSKCLNGMPLKWVRIAFPLHVDSLPAIKTQAGPSGSSVRGDFRFVIVPWVALRRLLRYRIDPLLKSYIRIMSAYQRWIFGGKSEVAIIRSLRRYAKEVPCKSPKGKAKARFSVRRSRRDPKTS